MKRQPILLALALCLLTGAAIWGVNYRLDHPPLSRADKEFRALVAGADSVRASQYSCQTGNCYGNILYQHKPLNAAQTRALIERLRFTDDRRTLFNAQPPGTVALVLTFQRQGADIISYTLWEAPDSCTLNHFIPTIIDSTYRLHPRFVKPLRRTLDAYLPQGVRP